MSVVTLPLILETPLGELAVPNLQIEATDEFQYSGRAALPVTQSSRNDRLRHSTLNSSEIGDCITHLFASCSQL